MPCSNLQVRLLPLGVHSSSSHQGTPYPGKHDFISALFLLQVARWVGVQIRALFSVCVCVVSLGEDLE